MAATFDEADRVMTPLLGRPLPPTSSPTPMTPTAAARLNAQLLQTEITQPAVLTTDIA